MNLNNRPSMINPSADALLKKIDSRYTLVVVASRRARELLKGEPCRLERPTDKYVTDAMEEIIEDKISYYIE